jgi:HD domain
MHPYLTERMLQQSSWLAPLGMVAVQLRERLDGSGYPRGLCAGSISQPALILGAADAYQSMREPRPNRAERSAVNAAEQLRAEVTAGRMDPAIDRSGDLDDYTVNFVTIRQGHSLAPMVKGLPGDSCQCPHWGYLISGQITVSYADRQEVYDAGDAFYMAPGHVPAAATGSEFIQFSPQRPAG